MRSHNVDKEVWAAVVRRAKDRSQSLSQAVEELLTLALRAEAEGLVPSGEWENEPSPEDFDDIEMNGGGIRQMPTPEEAKAGFREAAEKYR